MRVLWTLPYLPWPITSGGKARQYHLLRQMAARGHAITLLVQSKTPLDEAARAALQPLVERLIVLPRRPLKHPLTLLRVALSTRPLLATVNGHAPALSRTFARLLDQPWDVVQIEHSYGFEPYAAELARRGQPFVLTEHNVESALGAATYDKWPLPLRLLGGADRWRQRRWERQVLSCAATVIAVCDEDAQTLARIAQRPARVVGNGVDTQAFAEVQPDAAAQRVLFVGNFEYAPNLDAVAWLLDEIAPRLWRARPQARIAICGHALPAAWPRRWSDARIEWHGWVPDLRDVQRQASAFIAPLRAGGGSKLKVLEALAAGLPLVSTREGISGLGLSRRQLGGPAPLVRVADEPQALADHLAGLLQDPAQARRQGEAARDWVCAHHDWSSAAAQLQAVWEAAARLAPRRAGPAPATPAGQEAPCA